ncbi:MAG: hypothetical protein IJH65_03525 [Methanobrevibacter sp.]|nr:hypothetical protein [Methanobrevibacter sp.]
MLQKQYHYLQHKRLSGVNSPSYGKKASPETIEKIKKAKKLQDTVSPPHKGISHSAETRLHLSELAKKQFSNPQNREKVSLGLRSYYKNNRPVNCKKVKCVETGLIFNSISEARKWLGKNKAHISECCNSKVKMSGGYHWEYFND